MNEQKQNQIDRYVRNEMTAEERVHFEAELAEDENLRMEYEFTKQVQDTLKNRQEKLEMMRAWDEEEKQESVLETARYRRRRRLRVAGGFLLVAVLIAGFFLLLPSKWETVPENTLPQLDLSLYENYRSGTALTKIVNLIQQQQYQEALQCIEEEEKNLYVPDTSGLTSDEEREQMEYEAAAARLDAAHLKWLKVYALVGLNRREDALEVLDDMRRTLNPYQQKADSLYLLLK